MIPNNQTPVPPKNVTFFEQVCKYGSDACQYGSKAKVWSDFSRSLIQSYNYGYGHFDKVVHGEFITNYLTSVKPYILMPVYFRSTYNIFSKKVFQKEVLKKDPATAEMIKDTTTKETVKDATNKKTVKEVVQREMHWIFCDCLKWTSSTIGYTLILEQFSIIRLSAELGNQLKSAKRITLVASLTIRVISRSYELYILYKDDSKTDEIVKNKKKLPEDILRTTVSASLLGINAAGILNSTALKVCSGFILTVISTPLFVLTEGPNIKFYATYTVVWIKEHSKQVLIVTICTIQVTALSLLIVKKPSMIKSLTTHTIQWTHNILTSVV